MKTKITILALLASVAFTYSQSSTPLQKEAGSLDLFKTASFSKPEPKTDQTGGAKASVSASENYYVEDFEGGTFPPEGWQTRNITGAEVWRIPNIDLSGDHNAELNYSSNTELDWLITPQHTVVLGDSLTFKFAWYCMKVITADTFRVLVSAISEVPADSLALEAAFSDTLFVFDSAAGYGWNKYSVSLDKYAGKQIYIAFKEHYINGHGVGIDDVTLGHRDIDITALNVSVDEWAFIGDSTKPAAYFQNAGYASATFDAVAEIEALGYASRKTFKDVAHDSIVEVVFDGLVPAATGAFSIKVYAEIAADENLRDNELAAILNVTERFTPAAWHMETPIPAGYAIHGSFPYTKKSSDPAKPDTTFLYVMGGYRAPNTRQDSIYKYNTLSKEWTYLGKSDLLTSDVIALQVKGKAYMAGGYIGSDISSSSLLIYDIEADSFMTGKSMPNPVRGYAAASYGDSLIYIFGGLKDNSSYQFTSDVLVYNIHTDEWAPATLLPDDYLMGVSAVIAGNKIVLTGSYETYTAISNKAYFGEINPADPYTINWSSERRPCQGIIFAAAGAWYGKEKSYAFFVGGQTTESQYNTVLWVYDLNDKKWLKGPDQPALSLYAATLSSVVRNDSVYMVLPGGMNHSEVYNTNQWLYIGHDKPLNYNSKDLAAVAIEAPDTAYANNEVALKASFTNKQLARQTFDAVMEITPGSYKSPAAINALEYLGIKEVSFPAWTPDSAGTYTVKIYAAVNEDEDASNDTLTSIVVVRNTIGREDEDLVPAVYSLSQNYPNPFNPSTVIKYSIANAGEVELKVYNMLGQEIKTLVNEMKSAGQYEVKFNAAEINLSSGVYIYRIKAGSFIQMKKLMLIK